MPTGLTNEPYLNPTSNADGKVIRWRGGSVTTLNYGTDCSNLTQSVAAVAAAGGTAADKMATLSGLASGTKYFYSLTVTKGDTNHTFTANGAGGKVRVVVAGDGGKDGASATAKQGASVNGFIKWNGNSPIVDVVFMTGDNAYEAGTDAQWVTNVMPWYKPLFATGTMVPVLGNHDVNQAVGGSGGQDYQAILTLPSNGLTGQSNTEKFYSWNYGNVHFVSLDSNNVVNTTSAMYTWANTDLQNNNQTWTVVGFHHAPYINAGLHPDSEGGMKAMRDTFSPMFDKYGVDVVLTGHAHTYARTGFIKYDATKASQNSNACTVVQAGNGTATPYSKSLTKGTAGTVYASQGSTSELRDDATLNSCTAYKNHTTIGMLYMEFNGNRLDANQIGNYSAVHDSFSIVKQ